jgi:hypothetical protein
MPQITFLRQENPSEEFTQFLGRHGYSHRELQYVAERDRVNVTERAGDQSALFAPKVLSHIEQKSALLFRLLEGVGIRYQAPVNGNHRRGRGSARQSDTQ